MRHIIIHIQTDGVSTELYVRKVSKERRFVVKLDGIVSEYGLEDQTNELIHWDGPELNVFFYRHLKNLINQYFPRCRAIAKLGYDDYADYDDY